MSNYKALLTNVKTFVFDYDGVMTNGNLLLQMDGQPLRFANVKDGFVLQLAVKLGYRVVVISGGFSKSVETRFEALGIKDVFLGIRDKLIVFDEYIANNGIDPETIVYMGDDIPDYKVMKKVGVPVCPADAAEEIKEISVYISDKKGGDGCVRDIIEQVLKVQGKWMSDESHHW
ncbi:MAG: HAD hydrolase family protein [Bacteroidales bacterium]|jgi:3-deoxy-D-manno-octulosonate 8-phosphate phosphatase (KDO 8-P phosphatase)|nr:HAD hydrolase family protein [Bacteroidales bacterium]